VRDHLPLPARPTRTRRGAATHRRGRSHGPLAVLATLALGAGSVVVAPGASAAVAPVISGSLSQYVDPMIGTSTTTQGWGYPAGQLPFGMVQIGPNTTGGGNSGYTYEDPTIRGFTLNHLQGLNPILPTVADLSDPQVMTSTSWNDYAAPYSHDDEVAEPGYYKVVLDPGTAPITAELTATTRVGVQRYTFPDTTHANVLLNPGQGQGTNQTTRSAISIDATHQTVTTYTRVGARYTYVAVTRFTAPFTGFGTWEGNTRTQAPAGATTAEAGTVAEGQTSYPRTGGWVTFDTSGSHPRAVEAYTAVSYVDRAGALANLAAEVPSGTDFDDVRAAATQTWETALGKVRVSETGGTAALVPFYSALYRAMKAPNVSNDVDGRYTGFDRQVHTIATGHEYYQNYSLWDTYRTQQQLLALIDPERSSDMAYSLVLASQQSWAPRWTVANGDGNVMTGDPVTPFLVSAWSQGLFTPSQAEEAYAVLRKNADELPPASVEANGRAGNPQYIANGFVPQVPTAKGKGGDYDLQHGGSATLEYALADATLSTMAAALGHTADAARYAARGQSFRTLWDQGSGFFRARTADGLFTPAAPAALSTGFHEGTAAQYQWLVQQDVPGLIDLIGGDAATSAQLDHFFAYTPPTGSGPGTVKTAQWVQGWQDYYGHDTYNPNNEPDTHAPWVYLWTGDPWKTADITRAALSLYTTDVAGVPGNDDQGQMGAWAVAAAIGLFPIMPGTDVWGISTPTFEHVQVATPTSSEPGRTLDITAEGVSASTHYIKTATRSGADLARSWLTGTELRRSTSLAYALTSSSSETQWASAAADRPGTIATSTDLPTRLTAGVESDVVTAEPGATVTVPARVIAQGSSTSSGTVTVAAAGAVARAGTSTWTAAPARGTTVEATLSSPLTLTVSSTTAPGRYPATITAKDASGRTVTGAFEVVVPRSSWLSGWFTSRGLYPRGTSTPTGLDGSGWYLLDDAVEAMGLVPGTQQTVTFGDTPLTYVLGHDANGNDHLVPASAATIDAVGGLAGATRLSFVGAATGGTTTVQVTVYYTDSSSSTANVTFDDWCGGASSGNTQVLRTQERGTGSGSVEAAGCGLFATKPIALTAGKSVKQVRIAASSKVHVFAVASDGTPQQVVRAAGKPLTFLGVDGTATVPAAGQVVHVDSTSAAWDPDSSGADPVATTVQWSLDGVDVPGATASSYTVTPAEVGHRLTVRATASLKGYVTGVATATATVKGLPFSATAPPRLSGTARVDSSLSVSAGTYSVPGTTVTYQWLRDGTAVTGATGPTLRLGPPDAGATVTVRVTASKAGYEPVVTTLSAGRVAPGTFRLSKASVSGKAKVGKTLRATGAVASLLGTRASYQWYRGAKAISGATSARRTLVAADKGKRLSVRVTVARAGYTTMTSTSAATGKVKAGKLHARKKPKVRGTTRVGTTLKVTKGRFAPSGVHLVYRWLRDGKPVKGARKKTYRLTTADRGARISVRVTVKAKGYKALKVRTKKTGAVR